MNFYGKWSLATVVTVDRPGSKLVTLASRLGFRPMPRTSIHSMRPPPCPQLHVRPRLPAA